MIERLIVECDRKIQRALKRLADEDAKAAIAISVSEVTLVFSTLLIHHVYMSCRFAFTCKLIILLMLTDRRDTAAVKADQGEDERS